VEWGCEWEREEWEWEREWDGESFVCEE
jgi:hypothetical protein